MLEQLIKSLISGMLNNTPAMQAFNQMMGGKSRSEQIQTIMNIAKTRGIDPNEKIFSREEVEAFFSANFPRQTNVLQDLQRGVNEGYASRMASQSNIPTASNNQQMPLQNINGVASGINNGGVTNK